MLDFIMVPAILLIIGGTIYKLFELYTRRKERIMMIENQIKSKGSDCLSANQSFFHNQNNIVFESAKFLTLKLGLLAIGIGLGLLVGFFITQSYEDSSSVSPYVQKNMKEVVYGASTLLFGGMGLVISFILEYKMIRKEATVKK